ncbi:MAG: autotransporter outer membrane beta-barrel domain-containing protein [Puniceicoccales bacterium]|nr:autotransporter outer membrane beta-barrel domain-containing protein [Puniceicoccales bacterium]
MIVIIAIGKAFFSKNTLLGLPPMTPEEVADLVVDHGSVEEMLDAEFDENSVFQRGLNFGAFVDSLRDEDLRDDGSFRSAVNRWRGIADGQSSMSKENIDLNLQSNMYVFLPDIGDGEAKHVITHVNSELASLTLAANTLLANAIADRMISVKGCLADPFIHIIYGHAHQNKIAGLGYNSRMGGFAMGLDDVWTFPNERYLRIGVVFGYAGGKTAFSGSAVGLEKTVKHDIYTIELFSAYEFFNDRRLKTNIGSIIGYSFNDDRLHRIDLGSNVFDAKVRSNNVFIGMECVKNLYAYKDYQFGLWLRANYSRIAQKGYDESTVAAMGAQHVSAVNHDFFTTVVGFNVEKEILDSEWIDKKLTLSLKTGWECQVVWKHSDATFSFDNNIGLGKFAPVFRQPSRNAAIVSLGASQKLNIHWSIVGSYIARFNKDIATHNLSLGAEYSF